MKQSIEYSRTGISPSNVIGGSWSQSLEEGGPHKRLLSNPWKIHFMGFTSGIFSVKAGAKNYYLVSCT